MKRIHKPRLDLAVIGTLALICTLAAVGVPARADSGVQFSSLDVIYTFGEQVIFQAQCRPVVLVKQVYLFFQPAGEDTRLVEVDLDPQGVAKYSYDLTTHYLRPFSRTQFWFQAELVDGEKVESEKQTFDYIDNRQTWQSLDNGVIQVNWLNGDLFYGQDALNSAAAGARMALAIFPGQNLAGLRVYLYDSAAVMQAALNNGAASWAVGEASPDLGIVTVSIMPGVDQQLEMDRQIPHEIMHYLLYQIAGDNYHNIPMWLNEGLSSITETYANSDYKNTLNKAVANNGLLPLNTLCSSFPQDASNAFLAYAQSDSFVRFLQEKYGNKGLLGLVQAYQNGYSCEEGVVAATGSSLSQLDYRWRQESLGLDTGLLAVQNLLPFILIAAILVLVPLIVAAVVVIRRRKPDAWETSR